MTETPAPVNDLTDDGTDEVWRQVLPRLVAYLSRYCSHSDAEDVAQETALRAISHGVTFADADDLLRWCNVVARRQVIDHHRMRATRPTVHLEADEMGAGYDPIDALHIRDSVDRVLRAVSLLPAVERRAMQELLEGVTSHSDRSVQLQRAAARRRARARLRRLTDGAFGCAPLFAAIRRHWHVAAGAAATGAAAVVLTVGVVSSPLPATPTTTPPPALITVWRSMERPPQAAKEERPASGASGGASRVMPTATRVTESDTHQVEELKGPAGISDETDTRPNDGHQHLLCTSGDLVPTPICVG